MRLARPARYALLLAATLTVAEIAAAHGGGRWGGRGGGHWGGHRHFRPHIGLFIGAPLFAPWYYSPPPAYYPPVVVAPPSPPVYIERGYDEAPARGENYWYYCEDSQAYYPYVKRCPGGWRKVLPEPPE